MCAGPHGKPLDEQSKRLFACVEAVNDTLGAHIVTQCRESNPEATTANGPKQKNQEETLSSVS